MNPVLRPFVLGQALWVLSFALFAAGVPVLGIDRTIGLLASGFGLVLGGLALWWARRQRQPRQE